jgi:hypothetical protein
VTVYSDSGPIEDDLDSVSEESCPHEAVEQFSTIYARTFWTRQDNGWYEPDQVPCSSVIDEETDYVCCADCGAVGVLEPDHDGVTVFVTDD